MKLKKRGLVVGSLVLASILLLTACTSKGKPEETNKEEITEEVSDKEKEDGTRIDTVVLVENIIGENFENVRLKNYKIDGRMDNPEELYIADLELYLDVEDKEEAERLISEYSEVLFEKLYEKKKYEEVVLIWTSPNHKEGEEIEKIDYKG